MAETAEAMSVSAVEENTPQAEEVTSAPEPVKALEPSEFSTSHFTGLSLQERFDLIRSVGEECIQDSELMRLLNAKNPNCYDGFEPSGRMHIAQGVMKALNVNKLTKAGCTFKFWIADWFALLNNKMGWTLLHDGSSPQGSSDEAPIPRDHHVAVVRDAEMVVHAGRSGSDHDESVPLADLWVFNVHLAKWTQIKLDANDPAPTSRFLHMGALSQDRTRMYVFGGQHTTDATMDADPTTEKAIRYNDVWALNLVTRRWDSLFETRCS